MTRRPESRDFRGRWVVMYTRRYNTVAIVYGRRFSSKSRARRFARRVQGVLRRWRTESFNVTINDIIDDYCWRSSSLATMQWIVGELSEQVKHRSWHSAERAP